MALPVLCVDIGVADGIAAVDHPIVSHIDAYMGNARCIIGSFEENQITGLCIAAGDWGADVIKPWALVLPTLHPLWLMTLQTKPEQSKEVLELLSPQAWG